MRKNSAIGNGQSEMQQKKSKQHKENGVCRDGELPK